MEIIITNHPPGPGDIPEEHGKALGRTLCGMYQRLISTPEGRAKLAAQKARREKGETA